MNRLIGKLVDLDRCQIYPVELCWSDGRIDSIEQLEDGSPELEQAKNRYLLPGFVDAHIHIESSMLVPSQFARVAVTHGTIATVSDPHEIANVLGVEGVRFMLEDAARVPFRFFFGAPSCVPATAFETTGATIDVEETAKLLDRDDIHYLAEMMNFPGVLQDAPDVQAKIAASSQRGKPVDGHAPGLRGPDAIKYFNSGITTDHECTELDEALEKLEAGAKIQIREGSAAKNFEALYPLIDQFPGKVMLCSDDKHPDELLTGHINALCARAIEKGCDLYNTLIAACRVPVEHYDMELGQLRVGDRADFIEVESLETFQIKRTFLAGTCVADSGISKIEVDPPTAINRFRCDQIEADDLTVHSSGASTIRVIVAHDHQLITTLSTESPNVDDNQIVSDTDRDILKLVSVNRYSSSKPAVAFAHSFGLKRGAIAGSVGHDSHNILAVGVDDSAICNAVNAVIANRGGLVVADDGTINTLSLPVGGLMSIASCQDVGTRYKELDALAKQMGSQLHAPFMTLSFMGLLVIPSIKLSDRGLFDADAFRFVDLEVD